MSMSIRLNDLGNADSVGYGTHVSVMCGCAAIAGLLATQLEACGFVVVPATALGLILDMPTGFAFATLLAATVPARPTVVVTGNTCPEYWDNLVEAGAQILIADGDADYPIAQALMHAIAGARYRATAERATVLTPTERRVLHMLACGCASQQIAEQLRLGRQTVRNMLTAIYHKLGVADRQAAQNYYWGVWPPPLACADRDP